MAKTWTGFLNYKIIAPDGTLILINLLEGVTA
jgi:hypothetical protein